MPNDVFRAIDAELILSKDDSPEGELADEYITQFELGSVGRLQGVTIRVTSDVKPFYEIGRRYPTHLRPGVIETTGTIERAHINGALLRLLLGKGGDSPPDSANFIQPAFTIIAQLKEPSNPDQASKIRVFGVKFSSWNYNIPTSDFVMESVTFQAMRVDFGES